MLIVGYVFAIRSERMTAGIAGSASRTRSPGLPHISIPGPKLEPGHSQPAFGLAEAERKADQALAARSLLGLAADTRGMSVA